MKKVIVAALIALLVLAAFFVFHTPSREIVTAPEQVVVPVRNDVTETSPGETARGVYEEYAPEKFEEIGHHKVVFFFSSSSCKNCAALDTDIKNNADAIPSDVAILNVNFDVATAIAKRFEVVDVHTLVEVDGDGNILATWKGSKTLADVIAHLK